MEEMAEQDVQHTAPPPRKKEKDQRGAGSGQHANDTRDRNYNEDPDEHLAFAEGKSAADYKPEAYEPGRGDYAEGDPAKGKLDLSSTATEDANLFIPMRDRRAYLKDQAEKNEAANDELNAIQVDQNRRVQKVSNLLTDPDYQRDVSMETAVAQLEMHDPDKVREQAEAATAAQEERAKADSKKDEKK